MQSKLIATTYEQKPCPNCAYWFCIMDTRHLLCSAIHYTHLVEIAVNAKRSGQRKSITSKCKSKLGLDRHTRGKRLCVTPAKMSRPNTCQKMLASITFVPASTFFWSLCALVAAVVVPRSYHKFRNKKREGLLSTSLDGKSLWSRTAYRK